MMNNGESRVAAWWKVSGVRVGKMGQRDKSGLWGETMAVLGVLGGLAPGRNRQQRRKKTALRERKGKRNQPRQVR